MLQATGLPSTSFGHGMSPAGPSPDSRTNMFSTDLQIVPLTSLIGDEGSPLSFRLTLPSSAVEPPPSGKMTTYDPQFGVMFGNVNRPARIDFEKEVDGKTQVIISMTVPNIGTATPVASEVSIVIQMRSAHTKAWTSYEAGYFRYGELKSACGRGSHLTV